jgi:signal transduction histidine kinase
MPAIPSRDFEDFIYLISHDVRNSVRALIEVPLWITEDLQDEGYKIQGTLAEHMGLMNTHTRRLDRMLNDLLVYSRIGRMQVPEDVDLAEAIDNISQEIRIPDSIRLELDLQQPSLHIGEKDGMTLLTALLSNAVRHRDAATSLIRIMCRSDGDHTILTFADNGPGIAPEYREKAFSAMTTLKSRDEVEGSGMGLAHLRKILCHYSATLTWLDDPSGRGVGFEMRFPG